MMSTATECALGCFNQTDRPWHSPLPHNKAMSLECLDHRIHRGSRHEKVSLNVGFRGRAAESQNVPRDELQILELPPSRANLIRIVVGHLAGRAN